MTTHDPRIPSTYRLIESLAEFQDALRDAFAVLAHADCREVWISDPTFADWPLGERAVVESLSGWAMSHRRMTVLALRYDEVPRRHPRWVDWRRQWAHVVDCRTADEFDAADVPTVLLIPGVLVLRLITGDNTVRGSLSTDLGDIERAKETIDAMTQRSHPGFPATTLGL